MVDEKNEKKTLPPPPQDVGRSALTSDNIDDVLNEDGTVKQQ